MPNRVQRFAVVVAFILAATLGLRAATFELSMNHVFNGVPLTLNSMQYRNAADEVMSVERVSYLLSDVAFERGDGKWVQLDEQFAWMDGAKRRVTARLDVPSGIYRAMRFSVGLNAKANSSDVTKYAADHPLNPNLNGLHWSWQGGYIFLALEGLYQTPTTEPKGYSYHFARTNNCTPVTLAANLDLTRDARVVVDFDIATVLNSPRLLSFLKDGASTHSRDGDPVATAIRANLPGAFRIRQFVQTSDTAQNVPVKPLYLPKQFTSYRFQMSGMFPIPSLPRDNPLIEERVSLGEKLFNEKALSRDGSISCASCHLQSAAFSDSRRFSIGVRNQSGTRQGMPLFNMAWKSSFFWDGRAPSLRAQALMPIQDHVEMDQTLEGAVSNLNARAEYPPLFEKAFGTKEITAEKIGLAIEQFVLTLTSFDSKFDRVLRGQEKFTDKEQRGFELFMTEYEPRTEHYGADCFHCHGGPLFSDHQFHNNGIDGKSDADPGRFKFTKIEFDRAKFSTPSLRNIALTAPYMHDGRFKTLEEVVEHYSTGVKRSPTLDPNIAKHPDGGIHLSAADKEALVAFLKSLTDPKFAKN
ncbi:MAG: MbnP family protein [Limisphaerales bacterium]